MLMSPAFSIRLTQLQLEKLDALSASTGLHRVEHIRRAVDEYLENLALRRMAMVDVAAAQAAALLAPTPDPNVAKVSAAVAAESALKAARTTPKIARR